MKVLEVKDLEKSFVKDKKRLKAVGGISFHIEEGTCLGIVGESGCGKSTTANLVARLLKEDRGEIIFLGTKINTEKRLKCIGKDVQMVFQNPKDSFNPRFTLLECVIQGAQFFNLYDQNKLKSRALELLDFVGLKASYSETRIGRLSGGECQRAAIARALICEPKLIILDEATSALDVSVQAQIMNLICQLKNEQNVSFLFITHDLALASTICDEIAVMRAGEIIEYGKTHKILKCPGHPYTKQLLSCILPTEINSGYQIPVIESIRKKTEHGCSFYPFCSTPKDICLRQSPKLKTINEWHQIACHNHLIEHKTL